MFAALGVVVVLVAGLVVLVAGLAVWLMRSQGPVPNLKPFEAAVAALDTAPAVHYRSSAAGGAMEWDVRVARRGEAVGTATVAGQQLDVLAVEGRTFVRLPAELLTRFSSSTPVEALKGKWVTGSGVGGGGLLGPLAQRLRSPGELSQDLRAALDDATAVPTAAGDPGTVVDGVSALAVDTPAGRLFVTKDAPHRVLRLVRTGAGASSSLSFLPSLPAALTMPALPAQQGLSSLSHGATRPQAPPDPESTDFDEMTPLDVDDTYRKLQVGARELTDAIDVDVQFSLNGTAAVHCSAASCSIDTNVTVSSAGGGGQLPEWIDATLNASFMVEGRPAGTCTIVARLILSSGGSIGCQSTKAGLVFAQVVRQRDAQAQAQANAKASETPGMSVSIPYEVAYSGEAQITAKVQVDVTSVVQRLAGERVDASLQGPVHVPGLSLKKWKGPERELIEKKLGGHLDQDLEKAGVKRKYPVFDCWDPLTQTMTDIKTIDHRYDSYDSQGISSRGKDFVKRIVEFQKDKEPHYWGGSYEKTPPNLRIRPDDVSNYVLIVGFPAAVTAKQLDQYREIVEAGQRAGIATFLVPIFSDGEEYGGGQAQGFPQGGMQC